MSFLGNLTGGRALSLHGKGEYDKAFTLYEQAWSQGMDQYRLLRGYSVLLIRMEKYDRAMEVLKKLAKLPGLGEKEKAEINSNYAMVVWKQGDLAAAVRIMKKVFETTKNGSVYGTLGYLLIEQGDAQEALAFNQEALDYDDTDPVFLDNMGQTYYRLLGDKAAAKPYFDRAVKERPSSIDTNYFLALYDIENGDREKAKEHLETSAAGFSSPLNYATKEKIAAKLNEIS